MNRRDSSAAPDTVPSLPIHILVRCLVSVSEARVCALKLRPVQKVYAGMPHDSQALPHSGYQPCALDLYTQAGSDQQTFHKVKNNESVGEGQ